MHDHNKISQNSEETFDLRNRSASLGPIPIVIGVTGHRLLREADRPALMAAFSRILGQLRRDYPHTPFLVLSALAEGADRLAAWVALDFPGTQLGALLPLPPAEYLHDFAGDDSRAEFQNLLDAAATRIVVSQPQGDTALDLRQPEVRVRQYAKVGAAIVNNCHILAAFWDGLEGEPGGTADVVGYKLLGIPPHLFCRTLLEPMETGPVAHIATPRQSRPATEATVAPGVVRWFFPDKAGKRDNPNPPLGRQNNWDVLHNIERCNQDILALRRDDPAAITNSLASLAASPPPEALSPDLQELAQRFAEADALANRHQRKTIFAFKALLVLGLLFVGEMQLEKSTVVAGFGDALFMVVFVLAFGIYWLAKHGGWQQRFLDYRGLSEGLRVQFFWRAAGLDQCVADHYMRRQCGELDWIRQAIRGVTAGSPPPLPASGPWLAWVKTAWIDGQYRYFAGTPENGQEGSAKREARRFARINKFAVPLAVAGSILTLLSKMGHAMHISLPGWLGQSCQLLGPLLLALAVAIKAYAETMAYKENSRRYEKMAFLFAQGRQAATELLLQDEQDQCRRVLLEIGKEALAENGDWLLQHRARPLKMPHRE
ncbi:MAG: hypothetical protein B193_1989 [Solidesulfovibrio magneticus str. Maddingley MBC34]|uniref:SMODS and SLOG-associating 2TM effector domain-containing protein n=1 Tax=Solidesulfovibrio magneticus str. Maddingley MBC34 TaxID=1206767 RepID=K6FL60_9BACT|nr:MAG: hypothetical protein B193_1989 [Solidesulfovibrio magneticus str. Maddingley MBC34]